MREIDIDIDEDVFLPCYRHLNDSKADINFIWGGRDSGKSHNVAQRKIIECLSSDYFRYILVRKTANSIKDSQWQTIKDIIEDWGLQDLFVFKINPLEIHCINGNKFIARGCDDPGKLKSIQNPSGAWVEEGNQLDEEDFTILFTTLRSNKSDIQIDFTFNPECEGNYENFYLYKDWFKGKGLNFTGERNITARDFNYKITYTSTHSTYKDNLQFCKPQRIAFLESLKVTSPYFYSVYTLGAWGTKEIKNPFAHQYKAEKHESKRAVFDANKQVIIGIDFNINPFSITFSHIWQDYSFHDHQFDEMEIKGGSIPLAAEMINQKYRTWLQSALMTGDAMGNRGDISQRDNAPLFLQLMRLLGMSEHQLRVGNNPRHLEKKKGDINSRGDVNYVLAFHPDFIINPDTCPQTCLDMKIVECDEFGIVKSNRNLQEQRADFLDNVRYKVHNFHRQWIERHQAGLR